MKGVLVVGHGSRQKSTEQTLEAVVGIVKAKLPGMAVEIAYMEFGRQDIPSGLDKLKALGADKIVVAPYFLFDGIHIRKDIPEILRAYQQAHPGVEAEMAAPLGEDARLAEVLTDRIRECKGVS